MNVFIRLTKEVFVRLFKAAQEEPNIQTRPKSRRWNEQMLPRKRKW